MPSAQLHIALSIAQSPIAMFRDLLMYTFIHIVYTYAVCESTGCNNFPRFDFFYLNPLVALRSTTLLAAHV